MDAIHDVVLSCGANPKLAYTALTYLRLRKRPLVNHTDAAFKLLMMLDDAHLAKSPVNRLPQDLQFTSEQSKSLSERFPNTQWQTKGLVVDKTSEPHLHGSNYGLVATLTDAQIQTLPDKLPASFRLLFLCRNHDKRAFALLKKPTKDWLLVAHCVSLWFSSTPEFLDCPVSYQFDSNWKDLINLWIPQLAKQRSFNVFEHPPNGLLVLWAFFTITRPATLPIVSCKGNIQVWGELFAYLFTNTCNVPLVKSNLHLLSTKGKLVALDILLRLDPDPLLATEFVSHYEEGIVEYEPVASLMLQRGFIESAHQLCAPSDDPPNTDLSPQQLVKAINDTPALVIEQLLSLLISNNTVGKTIPLLEKLLPLINTISIRGNGTMVKLEYCCLLLHAILMSLYGYIGYNEGVTQMSAAGLARANGLDAVVWKGLFSGQTDDEYVVTLNEFITDICGLTDGPVEISVSADELRKQIRKNVLINTINDTIIMVPDFCGFKKKPKRQQFNAKMVVDNWALINEPMNSQSLITNSQTIVDLSAAVSALNVSPEPYFTLAADNLRCPILTAMTGNSTPLRVQDGQVVVSINFCNDKSALMITRALNGSLFTIQLPIHRATLVNDEVEHFQIHSTLNSITDLVKKSTTLSRKQFQGSTDEWWRQQKRFGKQLKESLKTLETQLLGGMIGLFSCTSLLRTATLRNARSEILKVYARFIKVPRSVLDNLKDEIIDLFLEVAKQRAVGNPLNIPSCKALVADLNALVLDALRLFGHPIDYDMIDIIELEHTLVTLVCSFQVPPSSLMEQLHLVIIPDRDLVSVPWESLPYFENHDSISRCLSQWHYMELVSRKTSDEDDGSGTEADEPTIYQDNLGSRVYYVLNPYNDLPKAQEIFQKDFEKWDGICGQEPTERELTIKLQSSTCYIYIGHGSGHRMIRASSIRRLEKCGAVMLFGCSSAKLVNGAGPILDYTLGGCGLFLGFMWDVPNTDCNIFTFEFLKLCFEEQVGVFKALKRARNACRIYTTSLAPVVYGVP